MKLLLVTQYFPPFMKAAGPSVKVRAMARHLVDRGHDVTVLTPNYGSPLRSERRRMDGADVVYLSYLARYHQTTLNAGAPVWCARRVGSFDLLHLFGMYDVLGPVAAYFARRSGIPYLLEPLGMFRSRGRSPVLKRIYHALVGERLVRGAALFVATSESERDDLRDDGVPGDRLVVRRNGIVLSDFEELPPPGRFRTKIGLSDDVPLVLYVGRIARIKGVHRLVEAFSSVDREEAVLALVGPRFEETYARELEEGVRGRDLEERVRFLGPRFGRDKAEALVDADLFVLPSDAESFGNAAAEALACGTPVLLTERCGIAPLVTGRAGVAVPPDVGELGRALRRLVSDGEQRRVLQREARAVARELGWEEPVTQQERIYRECVERGGSPDPIRRAGGTAGARPPP